MSAEDPTADLRTKKREPGKISKAIKLGVVGDGIYLFCFSRDFQANSFFLGTVGKTTLLMSYTLHAFLDEQWGHRIGGGRAKKLMIAW